MVRFHWHVEQGMSAYMPPGGITLQKDSQVQQASCEIEVPGQKETLPAILTLPPSYLKPDKVKEVGIILGHGSNAADWNGKFLTELAAALACQGYLVVRCYCKQKEQRRQRMFEKALDAAATSPFARGVTRWLLAGLGNGARVAAVVGTKCRGTISGFALLSYPLEEPEPMPPGKGRRNLEATPGPPDSAAPLLLLQTPVLFVTGDADDMCSMPHLRRVCKEMQSSDIRFVVMKAADATLKPPQARSHNAAIVRNVADTVLEFAEALNNNSLHDSSLPCFVPDASDEVPAAAATAPITAEVGSASAEQGAIQQGDNPDQVMSVLEQQLPGPEQPIQECEPVSDIDNEKQTHEAQPQLSAYQRHSDEPVTFT
ncbi:hypothetical protein WJX77_005331 [Trebouxia sp. C0004]